MSSLPSFKQFNESVTITDINEGVFYRLPKDVIGNELYLASKNLANFYQDTSAGRDIDTGVIDTIIRNLDKVKKAVKKFNSKEEVTGTVYEGEVLVYDEIGNELEALKAKINNLMRTSTDKKWVTALGQASSALSTIDRNLSQADAKLGVIPIKESLNEGQHGMAKKLLKGIVAGDSSEAEGIKLSKELADHYLYWINTSAFGMKNENLPLNMLINASFNWGIERQLPSNLKKELEALKASQKKNEGVESDEVNEASVQVAGHGKPSGAQVLATVIIDMLDKQDFLHPDTKKSQKQLIDMVKNVIMDSTF
jgi:hypothetical protein